MTELETAREALIQHLTGIISSSVTGGASAAGAAHAVVGWLESDQADWLLVWDGAWPGKDWNGCPLCGG